MKKTMLSMATLAMAAIFATGLVSCNKKDGEKAPSAETNAEAKTETVETAAPANDASALINRKIEGIYINANDLEKAVLTETLVDEVSGFTLNATAEKTLEVKSCDPRQIGDDLFTQTISTKGSGKFVLGEEPLNFRTISFPAKAGDSIIVYATTSSKTDERPLHVVNMANAEEIGTITMMPDNGKDMTVAEVLVKEDGNYCIYSTSGTGYIYQIKVGK
ncbi:MAG: hypothetical protein IKN34_02535 [Treponema sp.]|nr:hypothetical protein [Treponema sp.]